ncbi:MAG: hypothetical protein A2X50_15735 [Candidatus Rokubacteria bacterium GWF2_70_14]|nr:MAG: hypothetical protein A2X50_15735 [Candidatus Rokubacteria bacterium GWF2_70_14]
MADRGGRSIVVDSHYHLLQKEWLPEPLWETLASHLAVHISGDQQQKLNAQEFAQKYFPMMWDPEGEHLLRRMDEVGIDVTVMLVDDFGLALGEAAVSIEGQNKAFADLARRHPDRLIACAGVDPRRKNAVKILRRCVEEWGMRGVKYHPDAGWDPDGRESYRLLEHIQEWGIPVVADHPVGAHRLLRPTDGGRLPVRAQGARRGDRGAEGPGLLRRLRRPARADPDEGAGAGRA